MPKRTRDYGSWLLQKLADPQLAASYLNAALSDSPEMFLVALRRVAAARRMANVAKWAGVKRESLYKTLSKGGNPRLNTLTSVLDVLGLGITIVASSGKSDLPRNPRQLAVLGQAARW